ncbi:GNAT family N-acetyltransferase, partial [bacterium]|nr:GNAT family N-acetyltransferase [bacterium]
KIGSINSYHKYADVGFLIGEKDYWGKGIATEAIKLATDFAFNTLGLQTILDIRDAVPGDGGEYSPIESTAHDKVEITDLMLDAHLTLSKINERNAVEFKDVVEFLKQQR